MGRYSPAEKEKLRAHHRAFVPVLETSIQDTVQDACNCITRLCVLSRDDTSSQHSMRTTVPPHACWLVIDLGLLWSKIKDCQEMPNL